MSFQFTTQHAAIKRALIRLVGIGTEIEPGVSQVDTVTVDAAEVGVTYDITVSSLDADGNPIATETVGFTADAAPTLAEIRDGLIAAAAADEYFSAVATAAVGGADSLTLTAVALGGRLGTTVADDGSGSAISVATTTVAVDGRVIWQEQDHERIALPSDTQAFALLTPVSDGTAFGIDQIEHEYISATDKQERRTEGLRRMGLSVEVYTRMVAALASTDAHDRIRNLLTLLDAPIPRDFMTAAHVSVIDHGEARSLNALLGEQWEARAQVDVVVLYVVGTLDDDTDFAEVVGNISEADGTFVVNE